MIHAKTQDRAQIIALVLMAIALPAIIMLHLLPALLAGLLVHELVHVLAPRMIVAKDWGRAKIVALVVLLSIIVVAVAAMIIGIVLFLRSDAGSISALLEKLAQILERTRETLPASLQEWLPDTDSEMQASIVNWLRGHAREVQSAGGTFGHAVAVSLIGIFIGGLVSLHEMVDQEKPRFLANALVKCLGRLADAFRRVVFAQVRISALNTLFTALYLVAILPLAGIHLPLIKTMILITFLVGLLPVLGNLISNSVIVIISLSYSLPAAIGSLAFLVVIHKLEYFINARIVGAQIKSSAWELLTAMLVMEALFGLPGIVAAPIFYAYFKSELINHEIV